MPQNNKSTAKSPFTPKPVVYAAWGLLAAALVAHFVPALETVALVQLYGGDKERAALVICPNEEYAGIAPSIRATGFQEKCFGDIRGTASENIQRLGRR